jgi:hypothetical protein
MFTYFSEKNIREWLEGKSYGRQLTSGEISGAAHSDFLKWAKQYCVAQERMFPHSERILAAETDSTKTNAWAVRVTDASPVTFLVLVSRALFDEFHRFNKWLRNSTAARLKGAHPDDPFLVLWGDLPRTEVLSGCYSAAVTHIAVTLVMHHELAHVSLGHLSMEPENAIDEQDVLGVAASSGHQPNDVSQALEVDADIHAFQWTQTLLARVTPESYNHLDKDQRLIWERLRSDFGFLRHATLLSAFIFLSSLGLRAFSPTQLRAGTHPPGIVRAMLLLHAEAVQAEARGHGWDPQVSVVQDMLLVLAQKAELDDELSRALCGNTKGKVRLTSVQILDKLMKDFGFKDSLKNWDGIRLRFKDLAGVRRQLESTLAAVRPLQDSPDLFRWFESGAGAPP